MIEMAQVVLLIARLVVSGAAKVFDDTLRSYDCVEVSAAAASCMGIDIICIRKLVGSGPANVRRRRCER